MQFVLICEQIEPLHQGFVKQQLNRINTRLSVSTAKLKSLVRAAKFQVLIRADLYATNNSYK